METRKMSVAQYKSSEGAKLFNDLAQSFKDQFVYFIPSLLTVIGILVGFFSLLIHVAAIMGGSVVFIFSLILTGLLWFVGCVNRHYVIKRPAIFNIPIIMVWEEIIYLLLSFMTMIWLYAIIDRNFGIINQFVPGSNEVLNIITSGIESGVRIAVVAMGEYSVIILAFFVVALITSWLISKLIKNKQHQHHVWIFIMIMIIYTIIGYGIYHEEYDWSRKLIVLPDYLQTILLVTFYIAPLAYYLKAIFFGHAAIGKMVGDPYYQ